MGVPPNHPFFLGIFHKPSSYWGSPGAEVCGGAVGTEGKEGPRSPPGGRIWFVLYGASSSL